MKKDVLQGAIAVAACIVLFAMSCAQDRLFVRWQGSVYNKSTQTESFLIWKDGLQFYRILLGDVEVFVTGVADKAYLYFHVRVANKSKDIINIYPYESTLSQTQDKEDQNFSPLRPRMIRKTGVKTIKKLILYGVYFQTEDGNSTRAINLVDVLFKDHSFAPDEEYGGYIVYQLGRMGGIESDRPFKLSLKIGANRVIIRGMLCPRDMNDELDTPEDLRNVQFSVK